MRHSLRMIVGIKYALVLSGIIIGTVGALAHSAYRAASLHAETHTRAIVDTEANLLADLGYNGLIHNFKNYVLRQSENYRLAAMEDHDRVLESLAHLERLLPALRESEIAMVRLTARMYRDNLDVARAAIDRGAGPVEIDALVKVDDTPAVHALAQIVSVLRQNLMMAEAEETEDLKVFVRGLLILIVAIMALLFLLLLETGRLHRQQLEDAERQAPQRPT